MCQLGSLKICSLKSNFQTCAQILGQSRRREDVAAYRTQNDYTVSLGKNEYCSVVLHLIDDYTIPLGKNEYCSVVLHIVDDYTISLGKNEYCSVVLHLTDDYEDALVSSEIAANLYEGRRNRHK